MVSHVGFLVVTSPPGMRQNFFDVHHILVCFLLVGGLMRPFVSQVIGFVDCLT